MAQFGWNKSLRFLLSLMLVGVTTTAQAATEWWDASPDAGLQHGDGTWSTNPADAYWSTLAGGSTPGGWANGNDATFAATGGASTVSINGPVTAGVFTISGSTYLLTLTNGARLYTTNATSTIGSGAGVSGDGMLIRGGAGVTSLWDLGGKAGNIGTATTSTNNYLIVDGAGAPGSAMMTNVGGLIIQGVGARLILTNGARVYCTGTAQTDYRLGGNNSSDSSNRWVIATNSLFDMSGTTTRLLIGEGNRGSNNVLIVDGGILTNAGNTVLITGTNSGVIVANGGQAHFRTSLQLSGYQDFARVNGGRVSAAGNVGVSGESQFTADNGSELFTTTESKVGVGVGASNNVLRIMGGSAWNAGGVNGGISIGENGGSSNSFLIDGSTVTNVQRFLLGTTGAGSSRNTATLSNGGKLYESGGTRDIGSSAGAISNLMKIVGGVGVMSLWDLGNVGLNLGGSGTTDNVIRVDGQGTAGSAVLTNCNTLGLNGTGAGNTFVVINGGAVYSRGAITLGTTAAGVNISAQVSGTDSLWDAGGQTLTIGTAGATSNRLAVTQYGLMTNAGVVSLRGSANRVDVSSGGRLYAKGLTFGATNVIAVYGVMVSGADSLLDLGAQTVNMGLAGATGNVLIIDQDATVDNVGLLTVGTNNSVSLLGGSLGVISGTNANGLLFSAGDGTQSATLKALGGVLSSNSGLLVAANVTLRGTGTVDGGPAGVTLTNGATLSPGPGSAGTLTIGGSKLTWQDGATYLCEITNVATGPGLGWDLVNVSSQLVVNGTRLLIRMESRGSQAVGFVTNADYTLRILTYGSLTGYSPDSFVIDSAAFVNGTSGWSISNMASSLYLVYRGAAAPATPTFTWAVPSNGNWSVGANWVGGEAPAVGGASSAILRFGDNGVPYVSSNDLAGTFLLNQLQFESVSPGLTNQIRGGLLVFTNNAEAAAHLDFLSGAGGTFVVSNRIRMATDTTCGGNAVAGVLSLSGAVTNLGTLTHNGQWTLALAAANELSGPVVVDSPGGILKPSGPYPVNVLNGSGSITLSNGMIQGVVGQADSFTFSAGKHNRQALIKGSGSVWSNSYSLTIANNATNVRFVVDGGRLYENNGAFFVTGARDGVFAITNGGQVIAFGNALIVGDVATNCQFIASGSNSSMQFNQDLIVAGPGGAGNRVIVEKGGQLLGGNNFDLQVGTGSTGNEYVVREGGVVRPNALQVWGVSNAALITGSNSLVASTGSGASSVAFGNECGNVMTIADKGVVSNVNLQLAVGGAYSNKLVVTNGGKLFTYAGAPYVANGTTNRTVDNSLIVTGPGSMWDVKGQNLFLCSTISNASGSGNVLLLQDGGLVTNIATLVVASGAGASNNSVRVEGGSLYAATITTSNSLPNRFVLTGSGQVSPGLFIATNSNFSVELNGGTLNLKNALWSGAMAQVVGDGAQAATLNILPGGTNVFANGLVIADRASLAGAGLIVASSTVYGALSPGVTGVGALTNNGSLTLADGASVRFKVAANTSAGSGWDLLVVTNGPLNLGGNLTVLLTGGFVPTNTQRFVIMTNAGPSSVSGSFANMQMGAVSVYTNAGGRVVGSFKVAISAQNVALESFGPRVAPRTILMVR